MGSKSRRTPSFEVLESRTMLTAVFDPIFGVETQKDDGDGKLHRPPINIVFWGPFWQGSNDSNPAHWDIANSAPAVSIFQAIDTLIHSAYLNSTVQYGADRLNMFINDVVWDNSDPGSSFPDDKVDDVIQNQIDNGPFPEPDEQTDGHGNQVTPIYLVVTPPGTGDQDGSLGFNAAGHDFDFPFDFDTIPEVWSATRSLPGGGPDSINLDDFMLTLSHEFAEVMTDVDRDGFHVNTPPDWAAIGGLGDDQIADKEPENYSFRMTDSNGDPSIDVQPVWSKTKNAFEVTDGGGLIFNLHPVWNFANPSSPQFTGKYDLTINGDQLGVAEDDVTLTTNSSGGIKINYNGNVNNFDKGYLRNISLNLKTGVNTVHLNGKLPDNVNLDMNGTSPEGGSINLFGPNNFATTWNITGADRGNFNFGGLTSYTFEDVESITGGDFVDTFNFLPRGSLSGGIDGGVNTAGGSNSLSFSQFTDQLDVNLEAHSATPIQHNFTNIDTIFGSANFTDVIRGTDAGDQWNIFRQNGGQVAGIDFISFENLVGGNGNDSFNFQGIGRIFGNVDGGGGTTNTLNYSALPGPITVNFNTHQASLIQGTFANIQNVVGSQSKKDVIIGPDANWIIDGTDAGSVNGITFSSIENLQGSDDTDTFVFKPGGSISGDLDGGAGANTLDYSNLTGQVTLDLANHKATGIGGTFSNIGSIVPPPGGINVVGPNTATTWTIIGVNEVMVDGFIFTNTSSIFAGSDNDTFVFMNGGRLDGTIDGGGGINTLSYAGTPGDAIVNLALHQASRTGGIFNTRNVIGGNGNNLFVGDDNANVLTGGLGRNVLIGRTGADVLTGGGGDNILIGDSTIYDTNPTALAAIFAEWNRTDISFEKRHSDLNSASSKGLNGPYNLDKKSIMSDGSVDALLGTSGLDWFFVTKKKDVIAGDETGGDKKTEV